MHSKIAYVLSINSKFSWIAFQYDFDVERNAIDKYQQDAIRRADEQANQFTEIVINQLRNSDDRPSSTSSSTSCDTDHQQQSMMINGGTTSSSFAPIPMLLNDTILQPIPAIDHVARSCTNTRVPLQSTNTPRIWNYEDFETKSANSPFDSLEIKTMDDRALLQLVLNNEQMRRGGSGSGQHPWLVERKFDLSVDVN